MPTISSTAKRLKREKGVEPEREYVQEVKDVKEGGTRLPMKAGRV